MPGRVVLVAVLLASLACAAAADARPRLSQASLLARLTDPVAALAPLPSGVRVVQSSSHDLTGSNVDGGSYGGPATAIGLPPSYVRQDADGAFVLLDVHRPGCLVRQWMTALGGSANGDLAPYGRLQLFFDDEERPRVDLPAADFFAGRDPRFPQPLVGNFESSSGGNYAYVPFCFARSLKVRVTSTPGDARGWWQHTLLLAPAGTPVETFAGGDARGAASALAGVPGPPRRRPLIRAARRLEAGEQAVLGRLRGAGSLRFVRVRVAPFNAATLAGVSLRVTADRARRAQIDVPLANLFGDGVEAREVRASAFGMDPKRGEGYFALPIPYRRGVSVSVAATRAADVQVEAWRGRTAPAGAGTLYGERRVETTREGTDVNVLDATGSGRLAALVLDILDGGPNTGSPGAQFFMEGDERVHVDGARSPAVYGTGTEDTFNGGFYYAGGAFTLPTHGAGPFVTRESGAGAQGQYRVFATDGVRWSSSLAFGIEHGGGDEHGGETYAATTFSYRGGATLARTDTATLAAGTPLAAYFEGDRDGNTTTSTLVVGGSHYPAPPADQSPEGATPSGVELSGPTTFALRVDPRNRGVVLRRLVDQGEIVPLGVEVDSTPAGTWSSVTAIPNPSKRWLEDDFALPPALTRRKSEIRVTLTPMAPTTLYGLSAFSSR